MDFKHSFEAEYSSQNGLDNLAEARRIKASDRSKSKGKWLARLVCGTIFALAGYALVSLITQQNGGPIDDVLLLANGVAIGFGLGILIGGRISGPFRYRRFYTDKIIAGWIGHSFVVSNIRVYKYPESLTSSARRRKGQQERKQRMRLQTSVTGKLIPRPVFRYESTGLGIGYRYECDMGVPLTRNHRNYNAPGFVYHDMPLFSYDMHDYPVDVYRMIIAWQRHAHDGVHQGFGPPIHGRAMEGYVFRMPLKHPLGYTIQIRTFNDALIDGSSHGGWIFNFASAAAQTRLKCLIFHNAESKRNSPHTAKMQGIEDAVLGFASMFGAESILENIMGVTEEKVYNERQKEEKSVEETKAAVIDEVDSIMTQEAVDLLLYLETKFVSFAMTINTHINFQIYGTDPILEDILRSDIRSDRDIGYANLAATYDVFHLMYLLMQIFDE